MAKSLTPPKRKNPLIRTRVPANPPAVRSRAAVGFSARAAEGILALQYCKDCGVISYPARDICGKCWSAGLEWRETDGTGEVVASTTLQSSTNVYFRERMPWRIGTIQLVEGTIVLAHLHSDVNSGESVRVIARTDKSGQGVLMALPIKETANMADDKAMRELTCDPKYRRVLVTDVRSENGQALTKALLAAGAKKVFMGVADDWKPFEGKAELEALENTEFVPLNVTLDGSVLEASKSIGAKVDILINTAQYVRPGSVMSRNGTVTARDEMEVNYFGLHRLLQHFGPIMRSRAADGDNNAAAWVNVLSVYALSNWPAYGTTSASQAAAYSLAQNARADFMGSGIKLVNVMHGPLDDEWHQPLSPPKLTGKKMSSSIIAALQQGIELTFVGDIANDFKDRWREDPGVLERELAHNTHID